MSHTAQQTLESTLILIATQLALWLHKSDLIPSRSSIAMRREIVGELRGDLLSVLEKGIEKVKPSAKGLGGKVVEGELIKLLKLFVSKNIVEN